MNIKSNFSDNFWDKNGGGWKILYKNFCSSIKSVKEFQDYLSECSRNELKYSKKMKRFKFSTKYYSSMSPIWNDLLTVFYKTNSSIHLAFQLKLKELQNDLKKYFIYLKNKKYRINKSEQHTKRTVKLFKKLNINLTKSKEYYTRLSLKYDKVEENDLDRKQKLKVRLEFAKHDYTSTIDNYNLVRKEYIKKFVESCTIFQVEEVNHLKTMRSFINTYTHLIEHLNLNRQKIFMEMCHKLNNNYTNEFLYENLIVNKQQTSEPPLEAHFIKPIQPDLKKLSLKRTALKKTSHATSSQSKPLLNNDSSEASTIVSSKPRKVSFLKKSNLSKNSSISRSNLLIVAVVSEAFDKQIEKINEFEKEKNKNYACTIAKTQEAESKTTSTTKLPLASHPAQIVPNNKNGFFDNLDDFIESVKSKHTIHSRV